jgi:hypothetical protein
MPPMPQLEGGTTSVFSEKPPVVLPAEQAGVPGIERRLTHRRDHGVQSRLATGEKGSEVYFVGESPDKLGWLALIRGGEDGLSPHLGLGLGLITTAGVVMRQAL